MWSSDADAAACRARGGCFPRVRPGDGACVSAPHHHPRRQERPQRCPPPRPPTRHLHPPLADPTPRGRPHFLALTHHTSTPLHALHFNCMQCEMASRSRSKAFIPEKTSVNLRSVLARLAVAIVATAPTAACAARKLALRSAMSFNPALILCSEHVWSRGRRAGVPADFKLSSTVSYFESYYKCSNLGFMPRRPPGCVLGLHSLRILLARASSHP